MLTSNKLLSIQSKNFQNTPFPDAGCDVSIQLRSIGFPSSVGSWYNTRAATASCLSASFNIPPHGIALSRLSYPWQRATMMSGLFAMTYCSATGSEVVLPGCLNLKTLEIIVCVSFRASNGNRYMFSASRRRRSSLTRRLQSWRT